jgi:hypothetical protein
VRGVERAIMKECFGIMLGCKRRERAGLSNHCHEFAQTHGGSSSRRRVVNRMELFSLLPCVSVEVWRK